MNIIQQNLFHALKGVFVLVWLSAQLCISGPPQSNEDIESLKIVQEARTGRTPSTSISASNNSVQKACQTRPPVLFSRQSIPVEIFHLIFCQIAGAPVIPPYMGPDKKRRPIYSAEQLVTILPLKNTSHYFRKCFQSLNVRWMASISPECLRKLRERNEISLQPKYCYKMNLTSCHMGNLEDIFPEEDVQVEGQRRPYIPVVHLHEDWIACNVNNDDVFSWQAAINAYSQVFQKNFSLMLRQSDVSTFFLPRFEPVHAFFDHLNITALVQLVDFDVFQNFFVGLSEKRKRMLCKLRNESMVHIPIDLSLFSYVQVLEGAFTLGTLSDHPSIERIEGIIIPTIAEQIKCCANLKKLSLGDDGQWMPSEDDPVCLKIKNCKNLEDVQLDFRYSNADFELEGCPKASVCIKRNMSFFLQERGAEAFLHYGNKANAINLFVRSQQEADALVQLSEGISASLKRNYSTLTVAPKGQSVKIDPRCLPYLCHIKRIGRGFRKERGVVEGGLNGHEHLVTAVIGADRVEHCPSLKTCNVSALEETVGALVIRDCCSLEKVSFYTSCKIGHQQSVYLHRLPALKELEGETFGWVYIDHCQKLEHFSLSMLSRFPCGVIALDVGAFTLSSTMGSDRINTLITDDLDQILPEWDLDVYVLSSRGIEAIRTAIKNTPWQPTSAVVESTVRAVLKGKGNVVHKELRA